MADDDRAAILGARTDGAVWSRDGADRAGYDAQRIGFNLALHHEPALLLAAATEEDIVRGVRFAAQRDLAVDLQATGHGVHEPMDDGLLITTGRLNEVRVDPVRRIARVGAGATSGDVLAACAPHGLAAPVGAAPGVGFVSYSLGGGLGMFGRRHGYAADSICSIEAVTADGASLRIDPDQHAELFWALRGGGANAVAVVALEVDLFPQQQLLGGAMFFPGERAAEVLALFRDAIRAAPDELSLSIAFVAFPDLPVIDPAVRGRRCVHLRVAWLGAPDAGEPLIAPLRAARPILDTVRVMPVTEIGSIHGDPVGPIPVHTESLALRDDAALAELASCLSPDELSMVEVRHLGAALTRDTSSPSAVGHRGATLNLFATAYPGVDVPSAQTQQRRLRDALSFAGDGGPLRNFLPSHYPGAASCFAPDVGARLAAIKAQWDPADVFRYAPSPAA